MESFSCNKYAFHKSIGDTLLSANRSNKRIMNGDFQQDVKYYLIN